jgi:D-proline reductase (dithiol) PrdB
VEIIEKQEEWRSRYQVWQADSGTKTELDNNYPWVKNKRSPFTPARRALPMLNLALISSAGAYIDGTKPFNVNATGGDLTFREIPCEIEARDLLFGARGYDPTAIESDLDSQIPLKRLAEFASNGIIGQLNQVWWSFCGFIPNAIALTEEMLPELVSRIQRFEVQAALLIPASRLCHQSIGLAARAIESAGIPTMVIATEKDIAESVYPPRTAFYDGKLGQVAGAPNYAEHQRRILDEALRLIEPLDQPTLRKLTVDLESEVELARGER